MVSRRPATVAISFLAVLLGTVTIASIISHHAASVLVQKWTQADQGSFERLMWKQNIRRHSLQMLATSPKPLGTFSDDCGSGGRSIF